MPDRLSRFWQELKRRNVIRVITVYAASAFVILELVDIVTEPFGLPDWTLKIVVVILAIGLILALILSWFYDLLPEEGMVKTEPEHTKKGQDVSKTSNSWKIASYISFVVIVGLIVLNMVSNKGKNASIERSIAILPFHNDSPDKENQYFIDGTMEAILDKLCKIKDLKVIARTSSEKYRDKQMLVTDIASELNVNYILEGSGQKYGDQIRLTLQLINAKDGSHLWSKPYNRDYEDILYIMNEIASLVANEIEATITPDEKNRIEIIPTENIEAYNEYLLGRYFYYKHSKEGFEQAITHFEEATRLDPEFVLPYVYLVFSYQFITRYNYVPPSKYYGDASQAIEKALNLDRSLGEAFAARALFRFVFDWDLYGPDTDFQEAIRLSPGSAEIYALYSQYLRWFGRYEEGIEISRKAIELDPVNPYTNLWLEVHYFYSGQYDRAIDHLEKMLVLDTSFIWTNPHLAYNYTLKGDYANALRYADQSLKIGDTGNDPVIVSSLGWVYGMAGNPERAHEILSMYQETPENGFYIAFILHGLGEYERSIEWLFKAYEARVGSILYLKAFSDSYFKNLLSIPRFILLLDTIGFRTDQSKMEN